MEGFGLQGSELPPGFRFHPTDQELIVHYLRNKVTSSLTAATSIIADIDLYKFNPWDLPDKALFGEGEWFFFTPRDRKYPKGGRPNRAAASGYWKATGTDKPILATGGSQCLGVKKALVFYQGRPPKGNKTDWVMHEYRLLDDNQKHKGSMRLDDWVLCRVRQKGATPAETEEKSGTDVPSTDQNNAKQSDVQEKSNNLFDWSDYQLLTYLLNPKEDEGVSSTRGFSRLDDIASMGAASDQSQPSPVSLMLNSMKRTLSFGALDEIMLSPSTKRLHFSDTIDEQLSPIGSGSMEQFFPEIFI